MGLHDSYSSITGGKFLMIEGSTFVLYGFAIIIECVLGCLIYLLIQEGFNFQDYKITFKYVLPETFGIIMLILIFTFIFITVMFAMLGVLEFPKPTLKEDLP